MAEVIGDGPRVKFRTVWEGPRGPRAGPAARLARAVGAMEAAGCCPILDDGRAAGNGAVRLEGGGLLVSPSGRRAGERTDVAMVELVAFDPASWSARYRSRGPETRPTSDAALYWAALVEAPARFGWPEAPRAALHGHVLDTERAAAALGLPMGPEETLFSTPEDRAALLALLARAPYPEHRTVVRRGHGFFTLGPDLDAVEAAVRGLATSARRLGLLP